MRGMSYDPSSFTIYYLLPDMLVLLVIANVLCNTSHLYFIGYTIFCLP